MQHQKRKKYDTDLTDKQWMIIEPFIPPPKFGGRPREVDIREVVNAIFYILKSGCQWRMLPNDFPKWQAVYYYFRVWKSDDTWKTIHDVMRGKLRKKTGKKRESESGNY